MSNYIYVIPHTSENAALYALKKNEAYVFACNENGVYDGNPVDIDKVQEEIDEIKRVMPEFTDAIVSWDE